MLGPLHARPMHGAGGQGVCFPPPAGQPPDSAAMDWRWGGGPLGLLSRPGFPFGKDQSMSLPSSHTSAHLGLGVIEDAGRLLAETGHHFLNG